MVHCAVQLMLIISCCIKIQMIGLTFLVLAYRVVVEKSKLLNGCLSFSTVTFLKLIVHLASQ